MEDTAAPGPIDFVLIEFPAEASTAGVRDALEQVLESGIVRLYDIAVLERNSTGISRVDPSDSTSPSGGEFATLAGAQSGLFDASDIEQAGSALEPDTVGLLIAYENAWASPFVTAAHEAGGQLVASQRIPAQVLLDALNAVETPA